MSTASFGIMWLIVGFFALSFQYMRWLVVPFLQRAPVFSYHHWFVHCRLDGVFRCKFDLPSKVLGPCLAFPT